MNYFIQVCLYIRCLSAIGTNANPLIGAQVIQAELKDFPFVVSIGTEPANHPEHHFCAGALISKRHVLTAAHCFESATGEQLVNKENIRVTFGSHDLTEGTKYEIEDYKTYKEWAMDNKLSEDQLHYDMAIITLLSDVENPEIAEISELPLNKIYGRHAVTAGWGETEDDNGPKRFLQKATLKVVPKDNAKKNYEKTNGDPSKAEHHLCTMIIPPVTLGHGDSGGPLLCKGKIIGVNITKYDNGSVLHHAGAQNEHQSVYVHECRRFINSFIRPDDPTAGSSHNSAPDLRFGCANCFIL